MHPFTNGLWLLMYLFVLSFCRNIHGTGMMLADPEENFVLYGYTSWSARTWRGAEDVRAFMWCVSGSVWGAVICMHMHILVPWKRETKFFSGGGTQWRFSSIGSWGLTSLVLFYFVLPHRQGLEELEGEKSWNELAKENSLRSRGR